MDRITDKSEEYLFVDNEKFGQELFVRREIAGKDSLEIAQEFGMEETEYLELENGKGKVTTELIQKAAKIYKTDPLRLISSVPGAVFKEIENATILNASNFHTFQGVNEKQNDAILKLIENVTEINSRVMELLEKK
ncbi:hypothetical protein SAMN05660226_02980 [Parapedobacter luteus]|uniref:Uncharacterized protein n=1 Tax=Parapedobacter luteus TaxID=623280 RepID=A0A1T5DTH6_9SPHI|nr:helix-turn-helix domain-containing protein [Parapedobacter luteus]SKB75048.1 hypothetical protein SAMN05660226_02980 [Parapedobacter luteus]